MKINSDSHGISIPSHAGTWYVVDTALSARGPVFLLEHEQYGDDAACLIVDEAGNVIAEDVHDGFDDPSIDSEGNCFMCGGGGCLTCQPHWFI